MSARQEKAKRRASGITIADRRDHHAWLAQARAKLAERDAYARRARELRRRRWAWAGIALIAAAALVGVLG